VVCAAFLRLAGERNQTGLLGEFLRLAGELARRVSSFSRAA